MLNIPQTVTTSDAELQSFISTIETSLEGMTGGPIINRTITAEYAVLLDNQTVILVRQRPLVSVTKITSVSSGTDLDISAGLDIDPVAGTIRRKLGWPFYGPFFTWLPDMQRHLRRRVGHVRAGGVQHGRPDHPRQPVGHPAWAVAAAGDGRPGDDDPARVRVRDPQPRRPAA